MHSFALPLIPTEEGGLLIPAEQVTALLRGVAADWATAAERGSPEADAEAQTVLAMTEALTQLADQIDAECIACASRLEPGY
ncbi:MULTISPECIES: DUF6213 family protein [unclassified Streptomyces]|uniref:DUF6213 family protein n=1 Tax=unclassified Streptomyces TaxID=2593676 RepID=UPI003443B081